MEFLIAVACGAALGVAAATLKRRLPTAASVGLLLILSLGVLGALVIVDPGMNLFLSSLIACYTVYVLTGAGSKQPNDPEE